MTLYTYYPHVNSQKSFETKFEQTWTRFMRTSFSSLEFCCQVTLWRFSGIGFQAYLGDESWSFRENWGMNVGSKPSRQALLRPDELLAISVPPGKMSSCNTSRGGNQFPSTHMLTSSRFESDGQIEFGHFMLRRGWSYEGKVFSCSVLFWNNPRLCRLNKLESCSDQTWWTHFQRGRNNRCKKPNEDSLSRDISEVQSEPG